MLSNYRDDALHLLSPAGFVLVRATTSCSQADPPLHLHSTPNPTAVVEPISTYLHCFACCVLPVPRLFSTPAILLTPSPPCPPSSSPQPCRCRQHSVSCVRGRLTRPAGCQPACGSATQLPGQTDPAERSPQHTQHTRNTQHTGNTHHTCNSQHTQHTCSIKAQAHLLARATGALAAATWCCW
jgi:hypothetical protein